ncbi:hypothetical protein ACFL4V_02590, partial [Candidatus Latescibacterota bacterium]
LPESAKSELLMHTHGHITVAPYIHGFDNFKYNYPGYRSEFMTYVDFFRHRSIIFNSLLGTTTIISEPENQNMKLDRIRYILTPGFRYEFKTWLIRGALHHECIHNISRPEINGSTWWNSFQIGFGSKGSYYLYLQEQYKDVKNTFLNSMDAQINFGYIMPAKRTLTSGQNHEYHYEIFSLVRYQLGSFKRWVYFVGLRQNTWVKNDNSLEHQINITFNFFLKGTVNFTGFFYTYNILDTFSLDNADGMGAFGYKIIF